MATEKLPAGVAQQLLFGTPPPAPRVTEDEPIDPKDPFKARRMIERTKRISDTPLVAYVTADDQAVAKKAVDAALD